MPSRFLRAAGIHLDGPPEDRLPQLLRDYRRTGDRRLRDTLAGHYLPLVRRIAGRYVGRGVDFEDLVQSGTIGLLNALRRYEPSRGAAFGAYACRLIAGEIQHSLRDGVIYRFPRWLPPVYRDLAAAVSALQQGLGRTPTIAEIAARMNLKESGVAEILRVYTQARVLPLGDLAGEDADVAPLTAERAAVGGVRRQALVHQRYVSFQLPIEDRILVLDVIGRLAGIQRKVIYYLFYMDLTQTEAARRLRIPPKRVSRVLAAALRRLAGLLRPARGDAVAGPAASARRRAPLPDVDPS